MIIYDQKTNIAQNSTVRKIQNNISLRRRYVLGKHEHGALRLLICGTLKTLYLLTYLLHYCDLKQRLKVAVQLVIAGTNFTDSLAM